MAPAEFSSENGLRGHSVVGRSEAQTVVWLSGEHDLSTVAALSESLAGALALDEADLVLDLSGVEFMGAVTNRRHRPRQGAPGPTVAGPDAAGTLGVRSSGVRPLRSRRSDRSLFCRCRASGGNDRGTVTSGR